MRRSWYLRMHARPICPGDVQTSMIVVVRTRGMDWFDPKEHCLTAQ